ncbi:hypothetical protein Anas_07009 [Armadillidium nasatum]|uniref:Uncharacterized protein n=1 Tax=Armadillidium nasatum TaxID=96803 RepID=A0A5N5T700_9CRUS|nr:hypothetical protein Anas_07009 [Armadillidium nasatum]
MYPERDLIERNRGLETDIKMSSIVLRRLIFTIFALSLFLLLPCSAYRFINPRNNIPLVYSNQPTIYAQQSDFPKPIPWNTFVALYSKFNKEKENEKSGVCDCKEKSSGERPVEVYLNPDCLESVLPNISQFYSLNYLTNHLPVPVNACFSTCPLILPLCLTNVFRYYSSFYDVEFWHHDDNVTEDSVKCPSLEIEFRAQSWMVSPSYCGTSDYAVCQVSFDLNSKLVRPTSQKKIRNIKRQTSFDLNKIMKVLMCRRLTNLMSLPLYTSFFDVEFWHHDDNVTEESEKCPSLEIEFQAQSWMVSPSYCGTKDYAVCQVTFDLNSKLVRPTSQKKIRNKKRQTSFDLNKIMKLHKDKDQNFEKKVLFLNKGSINCYKSSLQLVVLERSSSKPKISISLGLTN